VSINIYVGTGSRYESDEDAGVSHFLEHLFFKGTERRPTAQEISETIEGVGGILNAATDREVTVYWAKVARPHFSLAMDLLTDMLRHSIFDADELEKERKVVLEELSMVNDAPERRVETLTREGILDYVARQYVPNNTVVSVAGDITHEEVVDMLALGFGDWEAGTPTTWYPAVEANSLPRLGVQYWRSR
jgi:predicted Zn-dependent peptidase